LAIGYTRASTDDQMLSHDAQRASIEAYAAREGVQIVAWYEDRGVSGATPAEDREGLTAAIAALREHGAGVLLVAKRDRVARDVLVATMIERAVESAGARLVSADGVANGDNPADEFMRTVINGAAAYERRMIGARTKAALAAKKSRGEKTGGLVPYGYACNDGRLVPVPEEQAVIERVRALRAAGLPLRAISAWLASRGVVSRTGKAFAAAQVARMAA
jgi:DNA invertase Pin-like site-specific DNA recombinase